MVALGDVRQRAPDQAGDRSRKGVQQARISLIASSTDADDRPEKQRRSVVIFVWGLFPVQEWEEWMIVCEEPVELLD